MVTITRSQSQRIRNEAGSFNSHIMSGEQPRTVNLNESGYVSDVDFEGQRQSISASRDDIAGLTLNERLAQATQRRDQLLKR